MSTYFRPCYHNKLEEQEIITPDEIRLYPLTMGIKLYRWGNKIPKDNV